MSAEPIQPAPQPLVSRPPSSTLIVGDTGSGKTSLVATLADSEYDRVGAITDYYTSDGGGWTDYLQALANDGIVRICKLPTRDPGGARGLTFETIALATLGYWPVGQVDVVTGEMQQGARMVPPAQPVYKLLCAQGHVALIAGHSSSIVPVVCAKCGNGQMVTLQTGRVESSIEPSPGIPEKRIVVFDGLTSMSNWAVRDLAARHGRQELRGEESAIGGRIVSGEMVLGGTNRSHVGFAQVRAEEWVLNANTIPNLVRPPIWTALELRASDYDTKLPIYGPQIAGKARTSEVPAWFGNCLGAANVRGEKGKDVWRLYLTEWRDSSDGVPHLCKTRVSPGLLPEYLEDEVGPDGRPIPFSKFNLGYFFSLLDGALEKTQEMLRARRTRQAPGVEKRVMVQVQQPQQVMAQGMGGVGAQMAPPALPPPGRVGPVGPPVGIAAPVAPPATAPPIVIQRGAPSQPTVPPLPPPATVFAAPPPPPPGVPTAMRKNGAAAGPSAAPAAQPAPPAPAPAPAPPAVAAAASPQSPQQSRGQTGLFPPPAAFQAPAAAPVAVPGPRTRKKKE